MNVHIRKCPIAAAMLIATLALLGCDRVDHAVPAAGSSVSAADEPKIIAEILAADKAYASAWLAGDWAAASALTAPNYYGVSTDLELDYPGLEKLFPKAKAFDYQKQTPPHVRVLTRSLAMISYEMTMKETYEGRDISGLYWYATTWTRTRDGWKLLIEEEIPLSGPLASPGPAKSP